LPGAGRVAILPPLFAARGSRGVASRTLRSIPVRHIEIELGIGDVVQIGENIYTVIDIENGEVTFRIDVAEDFCEPAITSRTAK
jgi:hypothetical protein